MSHNITDARPQKVKQFRAPNNARVLQVPSYQNSPQLKAITSSTLRPAKNVLTKSTSSVLSSVRQTPASPRQHKMTLQPSRTQNSNSLAYSNSSKGINNKTKLPPINDESTNGVAQECMSGNTTRNSIARRPNFTIQPHNMKNSAYLNSSKNESIFRAGSQADISAERIPQNMIKSDIFGSNRNSQNDLDRADDYQISTNRSPNIFQKKTRHNTHHQPSVSKAGNDTETQIIIKVNKGSRTHRKKIVSKTQIPKSTTSTESTPMSNQLKATKWESSPKSMLSTEDSISPLIKPQPYQAGPSVEPGPNNPVPKRVTTNILQRKPKLSLGFAKKDD